MTAAKKAKKWPIILILALLLGAIALLLWLNRGDAGLRQALAEDRQFLIRQGEQALATVELQDLLDLGLVEFSTTMATSISAAREVPFEGVELRHLLQAEGITLTAGQRLVCSGQDGYVSLLTADEVMAEGQVYICVTMDGAWLKPQNEGGYGPYLLVVCNQQFAQRWCKYLVEIEID